MSICIRHTRRQAFRWFLNKRDDVANAIKLDCRRLHACFRIFYGPFTVALLVHLRLFVSKLNYKLCFSFENWGRRGKKKRNKNYSIHYYCITLENIVPLQIFRLSILSNNVSNSIWSWIFCKYVSSLVSRFVVGLTLIDILISGFQTDP